MADKHGADPAAEAPEASDPRVTTADADAASGGATPLSELQRERDDLHDRLLRKSAEFDNYRKRIDRERREQADQAVTDLLLELLSAVDDFDRALLVDAGPSAAAYRKGIELIHAKLHDLLRKYDVRPIDTLGTDFDPNLHQAVMHEASPGHREGEVIGELQRGYLIHGRLLRPAMVKVAKP